MDFYDPFNGSQVGNSRGQHQTFVVKQSQSSSSSSTSSSSSGSIRVIREITNVPNYQHQSLNQSQGYRSGALFSEGSQNNLMPKFGQSSGSKSRVKSKGKVRDESSRGSHALLDRIAEEAAAPSTSSSKSGGFDASDIPEMKSLESFHKLWISSKHDNESLLKSQWNNLVVKISAQEGNRTHFTSKNGAHVTTVFEFCKILKTNYVVRFRAIELYEWYYAAFNEKMTEYLETCSEEETKEFFKRHDNQILLRVGTCILIASKLHSDSQVNALKVETIQKLLKRYDLQFNCKNIVRSETRILETLNYRCHWVTPLDLVEQLLCLMKLELDVFQRAHYFSILLLEYTYSDLERIRITFNTRMKKYSRGKIAQPLRCAAVVSAGLFIVLAETNARTTKSAPDCHKGVANEAGLPEEEVSQLAVTILDLLNRAK